MDEPENSDFEKSRLEYEDEMFEVKNFYITPSEMRSIIATRRFMEERLGTNGSIQLTMKISSSVFDCMKALDKHQNDLVKAEQKALAAAEKKEAAEAKKALAAMKAALDEEHAEE